MLKRSQRDINCSKAETELGQFMTALVDRLDLSDAETIRLLGQEIVSWGNAGVRVERAIERAIDDFENPVQKERNVT